MRALGCDELDEHIHQLDEDEHGKDHEVAPRVHQVILVSNSENLEVGVEWLCESELKKVFIVVLSIENVHLGKHHAALEEVRSVSWSRKLDQTVVHNQLHRPDHAPKLLHRATKYQ
jgi:hypothetical protein